MVTGVCLTNNNMDTYKLLDLSGSDSENEVIQFAPMPDNPPPQRKKRLKRRERDLLRVSPSHLDEEAGRVCGCSGPLLPGSATPGTIIRSLLLLLTLLGLSLLTWLALHLQARLDATQAHIKSVEASSSELPAKFHESHVRLQELEKNQTALRDQLTQVAASLRDANTKVEQLEADVKTIKDSLSSAPQLSSLPKDVANLQGSVATFGSTLQDVQSSLKTLKQDQEKLTEGVEEAGHSLDTVKSEISLLHNQTKKGLQTLTEPMEPSTFGWMDAATAMLSIALFLFDVGSDSFLAFTMAHDDVTKDWAFTTFLLIVIPLAVVNAFSLYWYWFDECGCEEDGPCLRFPKASPKKWTIRILGHMLLIGSIFRYIDLIRYGYKSLRRQGRVGEAQPDQQSKYGTSAENCRALPDYRALWIHAERDAANVDLLQSLLQDAPQLVWQLYVIAHTLPIHNLEGEIPRTLLFQLISVTGSLFAMSLSVASFSRTTRLAAPSMGNLSPAGLLMLTLAHFSSIAPQVTCFALLSTAYLIESVVLAALHWLTASFLVIVQLVCCPNKARLEALFTHDVQTGPCSRLDDMAYSAAFGLVLLYTFIDVGGRKSTIQAVVYHVFRLLEEAFILFFWYTSTPQDQWYYWAPLVAIPGFAVMGLVNISLYYFCTNPDKKDKRFTV